MANVINDVGFVECCARSRMGRHRAVGQLVSVDVSGGAWRIETWASFLAHRNVNCVNRIFFNLSNGGLGWIEQGEIYSLAY